MSARSFIICLLAAFALGFGTAALLTRASEPGHQFQALKAEGDSIQAQVDSIQPLVLKDAREWAVDAPQRAKRDTTQGKAINAAKRAVRAADEALEATEPEVLEHPVVVEALAARDSVIRAQDIRIATLTASRNRLSVLYARAIAANSALDDANRNLKLQVAQLRQDVAWQKTQKYVGLAGVGVAFIAGVGLGREF